jgi:CheY-like chemotaxis protein
MNQQYMDLGILLLDDDEVSREMVAIQLQMAAAELGMHITIYAAGDADTAWKLWKRESIHGIITDMVLSNSINGIQFLAEIRKDVKLPDVPAIILTGIIDSYNVEKMWSFGQVLHKPIESYFHKKLTWWLASVDHFWKSNELRYIKEGQKLLKSHEDVHNETH